MENHQKSLLEARISDVAERCEKGIPATLPFLTPGECREAERLLRRRGMWNAAFFWGGHERAERRCLFLLPDYLCLCLEDIPSRSEPGEVLSLLGETAEDEVQSIQIRGSGFCRLTHRDYLGAVLHLGLERSALGDLAVQNDREAVLFCSRTVAAFLMTHLERVANDAVTCSPYTPGADFTDGRHYEPVNATVASLRLDCLVAALTDLSREAAQSAVLTGLVEVDFEAVDRTDLLLEDFPVTLSVRGFGRFELRGTQGQTRKGRLRLQAFKIT